MRAALCRNFRYRGEARRALPRRSKAGRDSDELASSVAEGGRANGKGDGMMSSRETRKEGGNVFADIGVPNAEEHFVKAQLVFKIDSTMKEHRMRQVDAARRLGIRQPDVSKMLRGEFRQFSVETLLRFLVAPGKRGKVRHCL